MSLFKDRYLRALTVHIGVVLVLMSGLAVLAPHTWSASVLNAVFGICYGPIFIIMFLSQRDNRRQHARRMKEWDAESVRYRREAEERSTRAKEERDEYRERLRTERADCERTMQRQHDIKEMRCSLIHLLELP